VTDLSARNRANRRKGADWESALLAGLREEGFDVEQLHLRGVEDEGDLVVREDEGCYLVIEAKNEALKPGPFLKEAEDEAGWFAKHRDLPRDRVDQVVVIKRRNANWRKAYVLTTVENYFGLDPTS